VNRIENGGRPKLHVIAKLIQQILRAKNYIGVTTFFLTLVIVKIPTSFNNFWAEDGTFYQQALTDVFPRDIFSSGGGYIILISRMVARIVTLGPISYAPFINVIVVTLILSLFVQRLYINLNSLIKSRILKFVVSISVFLLPINSFDVIASGGGLHFQLIFISLVIILAARESGKIYKLDVFIVSMAILSDPLALITLAPLFLRIRNEVFKFWRNKLSTLTIITTSGVIQFIMVAKFYSQESRSISNSHSIVKTLYLFLDRVIGSTFVPHWGRVSSDILLAGGITIGLIIRALIGLATLVIILFFSVAHLKRKLLINETHSKTTLSWLLILPVFYWFTAGYLFNPEPRYAIFPGLSFLLVVLILLDHFTCIERSDFQVCLVICTVMIFSVLIWIFSPSPSDRRVIGPEWNSQISKGKSQCAQSNQESVTVRILPVDLGWKVKIPCDSLIK